MQDAIKSRLRHSNGRNEKEALKIFFEMIQEIDDQEAEDKSSAEEENADDIIEAFFANDNQDFPVPGDE